MIVDVVVTIVDVDSYERVRVCMYVIPREVRMTALAMTTPVTFYVIDAFARRRARASMMLRAIAMDHGYEPFSRYKQQQRRAIGYEWPPVRDLFPIRHLSINDIYMMSVLEFVPIHFTGDDDSVQDRS